MTCIQIISALISIFITNDLNSLCQGVAYLCFIVVVGFFFFFPGLGFFVLSLESSSSAFSFYLTFPVSVNLDETITCFGFEEVFLCGSVPRVIYVPRAFVWESWV